jgi:hypothetical protein
LRSALVPLRNEHNPWAEVHQRTQTQGFLESDQAGYQPGIACPRQWKPTQAFRMDNVKAFAIEGGFQTAKAVIIKTNTARHPIETMSIKASE